jgi:Transposase DDE domain
MRLPDRPCQHLRSHPSSLLAHRRHVGAGARCSTGENPPSGRSPRDSKRGYLRQPVGEARRKRGVRGYDRARKVNRCKRHLLVNTGGLVMKAKVHPADLADREGARELLERVDESFPSLRPL